ncbi:hypothetical protein DEO72_LG3g844 [Vigna unguiculata]|uniref:Uncharacterized protein n=1 Tax=Vigna unguiculata TaxID=3917 RepID=A0A4D6LCV0_VIGUN|nr:hypothetical protein DEO72_LG3g844 [Vigna unguiculata]
MSIRRWLVNFQLHEDSGKFPMFREMKKETYINMECKILYHTETAKDCWFIFACECTSIQPNVIHWNLEEKKSKNQILNTTTSILASNRCSTRINFTTLAAFPLISRFLLRVCFFFLCSAPPLHHCNANANCSSASRRPSSRCHRRSFNHRKPLPAQPFVRPRRFSGLELCFHRTASPLELRPPLVASVVRPIAPPSAASLRLGFGQSVAAVAAVAGPCAAALPPPQHRIVEGSPTSFVKNAAAATATCCCHPLHAAGAPSASAAPVAAAVGPHAAALPPPRPLLPRLPFVAATLCWLFRAV